MTAASLLVRPPADSAHQPRTSIVQVERLRSTGSREGPWERLERHKPKGLRAVLRGLGSSNAPRLPGGDHLGSSACANPLPRSTPPSQWRRELRPQGFHLAAPIIGLLLK